MEEDYEEEIRPQSLIRTSGYDVQLNHLWRDNDERLSGGNTTADGQYMPMITTTNTSFPTAGYAYTASRLGLDDSPQA